MGQRRLFAVGKQTLSSVVKHSVATVAWQLAFIPGRCRVCSQCKLLLNIIHAVKLFMAISLVDAQNKDSPPALLLVNRMGIHFLDHYWLMSTVISALFFLCVLPMVSLKLLWFLSASHLQWNSWPAPDPLMFHAPEVTFTRMPSLWQGTFSYAKMNDSVLRWKNSFYQHHLYPLSTFLWIYYSPPVLIISYSLHYIWITVMGVYSWCNQLLK